MCERTAAASDHHLSLHIRNARCACRHASDRLSRTTAYSYAADRRTAALMRGAQRQAAHQPTLLGLDTAQSQSHRGACEQQQQFDLQLRARDRYCHCHCLPRHSAYSSPPTVEKQCSLTFLSPLCSQPRDLLHPSASEEASKHKLRRLVQSPNSYFMDVKCPGCFNITTVFSHAQTVVLCGSCSVMLCQPTGGKARLTDGCQYRKKTE